MDIFGFIRIAQIQQGETEEEENESLPDLEAEMEEKFGEKKDKIMGLIEYYAKLRVLILKRMKNLKKIPQEFVDKYNDTITRIRKAIRPEDDDD